jgi:hypothetical protein
MATISSALLLSSVRAMRRCSASEGEGFLAAAFFAACLGAALAAGFAASFADAVLVADFMDDGEGFEVLVVLGALVEALVEEDVERRGARLGEDEVGISESPD